MSNRLVSCFPLLLVVAACGGNQPVPARLKGVSSTTADALSTAFPSDQSRFPACIVRYDFSGSAPALPAVECTTALVGGDPLHWITTCPSHPFVYPEVEVQVDSQHVPLFERLVTSAGEFTFSYGPMQSRPGVTVTQTDAAGNPLQAVFAVADLLDGSGAPVVGSGHQQWSWLYDGNERLTGVSAVFTDFGKTFLSMDIAYDDAALRINRRRVPDGRAGRRPLRRPRRILSNLHGRLGDRVALPDLCAVARVERDDAAAERAALVIRLRSGPFLYRRQRDV
jgi:hypothetical protein